MQTARTKTRTTCLMLAAPLLPVAIGLLLGIVADEFQPLEAFWYASTLVIATALSLITKLKIHLSWLLLGAASWSAGALLHSSATDIDSPSNVASIATDDGSVVRIRGVVITDPRQIPPPTSPFSKWHRATWRTSFLLDTTAIETTQAWSKITGRLRVSLYEPILDLELGESIELFGKLSTMRPPTNPGAFDWSTYNRRRGVAARLTIKHRENIDRKNLHLATSTSPSWLQNVLRHTRARLHQLLVEDLDQEAILQASLLDAMVLGQRSRVDRQLNDLFIRAGCAHFLAVSGVHVAIVMMLVAFGCRLISLHPRRATWIMIVSVLTYALIAEPRPSIWRATVMALLYCASRLLSRQRSPLNWLAASAICICLVDPYAAFNVGFQLSFVAVIGVIYVGPAIVTIAKELTGKIRSLFSQYDSMDTQNDVQIQSIIVPTDWRATIKTKFLHVARLIVGAATVSLGAWCTTLPIVLIHFNIAHTWGAVSSLVILPLVSISMALGFLKLIIGVLFAPISMLVSIPLEIIHSMLLWCVSIFASLPYAAIATVSPPWWLVGSYYLLALSLIARHRSTRNSHIHQSDIESPPNLNHAINTGDDNAEPRNSGESRNEGQDNPLDSSRIETCSTSAPDLANPQDLQHELQAQHHTLFAGLACLLSLVLLAVTLTAWHWPAQREAELRITFLAVGAGSATVLELSTGETILFDAGSSRTYDIGKGTVVPFLHSHEITAIDRVYITHANLDHYSGIPSITTAISTGPIVINSYYQSSNLQSKNQQTSPSKFLLKYLKGNNQPIEILNLDQRTWQIGDTSFELLWPPKEPLDGLSANNSSTVLKVTYASQSILLTGDIEQRAESALLQIGNLKADVLALPHHGSIESTTASFIEAVGANSLIRSAGRAGNTTTSRLVEMSGGAKLFNTANSGAITVLLSERGVQVIEFSPAPGSAGDTTNH